MNYLFIYFYFAILYKRNCFNNDRFYHLFKNVLFLLKIIKIYIHEYNKTYTFILSTKFVSLHSIHLFAMASNWICFQAFLLNFACSQLLVWDYLVACLLLRLIKLDLQNIKKLMFLIKHSVKHFTYEIDGKVG